ncbi:alpha-amylase family glycosyl hydrolase [Leptolyngbya sp. FACHB-261]|uniref:alpha-amylase family glycosyl hydrolase n=1 Tax=Leptolyngbya sp. FACHB-261 TaxID=2692806 RepID=UPI0016850402|nr:alpha-amylase family glycosyl hydrolase [Leptolyngbya sp. FACHB-261]MBD2104534.1 alpha amylase [Leptolyngbya sp. FACHB-261]
MPADLLTRKRTHFVLWRPRVTEPQPTLYIGRAPQDRRDFREIPLQPDESFRDLWQVAAQDCGLAEGQVYFYWFKVCDTNAYSSGYRVLYCTDPLAYTVDRRFLAPAPGEVGGAESGDPAGVVLYQQGQLIPCDPQGQTVNWEGEPDLSTLPTNNQLVIYELPTRWAQSASDGHVVFGNGTFRDALALLEHETTAPDFATVAALDRGHAHLVELGVNALELLPASDSDDKREWGYGTANYFAADFDLGSPDSQKAPTASTDLSHLIKTCHRQGLRFFCDMVMAFSRNNPYSNINFLDFYVKHASGDPEQGSRDGFGGDLFKYNYWVEGYHPITGQKAWFVPAREYLKAHVAHWLEYYRVDGLRLDSVNNIASYDFLQEFKDFARLLWDKRGGSGDRFLVVGEDLSVPLSWIQQNRLDGLWNEKFKQIVRQVILGRNWSDEPSFEWSVRKLIDCRLLGFSDGSQAVNYLTSHDIGGLGNERFYNWLANNGVYETEERIKLAFVCLLTAVGTPMILAGDEFADQQDLDLNNEHGSNKQVDPVNYSRVSEDWRQRIFQYVARLTRFRTTSPALAVNDTQFLHSDFSEGKRVLVWKRGQGDQIAVVVANFSDYGTPPNSDYKVPNWPGISAGKTWREITQDRAVPQEWVGREPVYPWEAKVYVPV